MEEIKIIEQVKVLIDKMNEEELKQLSQVLHLKLDILKSKMKEKHTIVLECDFRINSKRGIKPWAKKIVGIDSQKKGGYAFIGDFLEWGEVELCEGDVVVKAGMDGSYNNAIYTGIVYQVIDGELTEVEIYNYKREFVSMRNKIEELIQNN